MSNIELKPCPFCAWELPCDEESLLDILYRTGMVWRKIGNRLEFSSYARTEVFDGHVWKITCNDSMGGCGAEMHGLSQENVIEKWNKRGGFPQSF